jgi:hypothetical protein
LHRPLRIPALGLALLAALAACAGTVGDASRAGLRPGRRVVVGLYDAKGAIRLELANASHPDLADAYSHPRPDAALKLAPDELLDDLVRDLGRLGFEGLGKDGPPPAADSGVRGWVSLNQDGRLRTFVVPAMGASPEAQQAFAYMKLAFNEYYTHVGGLQFVNNPQGHDIFRKPQ